MSEATVKHTRFETLLETANRLMEELPGYRVEILGGSITIAPLRDIRHAGVLTDLMIAFFESGLHGAESKVLQGIGLWLPGGPEDYAIPDLSLVDADIEDHHIANNCYDPACFRMVLEVTATNYQLDLLTKVAVYGEAKIPVYVILDRKHGRVHVLTEPVANGYDNHRIHAPGEQVTLPESIGAEVKLDVAALLEAGAP